MTSFVLVFADEGFRLNERAEKALVEVQSRFREVQRKLEETAVSFGDNGLFPF